MKRKVIKQGASTLTTSLPVDWIKKQKIKSGDLINIEQINDKLIIENLIMKQTPILRFSHYNQTFIKNNIINLYCKGHNKIKIEFTDSKIELYLQEILNKHLIGFDIVNKQKNTCVLQNITEPEINQFETIFKKIFFNLSMLINTTEARLGNSKKETLYIDIARKLIKYGNLCKRIIVKRNPLGENTLFFWAVLNNITQASKEMELLNRYLDRNKVKKGIKLFSKVKIYYGLLEQAYFKKDPTKILELHIFHQKHLNAAKFDKMFAEKNNIIQYHTIVAMRNLFLASNGILGMIMDD